jgi:phospholipase/carboxylesterase
VQTQNEPYSILDRGQVIRILKPEQPGNRVLLLLHGWTGDENVMWIFTRFLPRDYWILSPRGPIQAPAGGYGWTSAGQEKFSQFDAFETIADGLFEGMDAWLKDLGIPNGRINLMGFSQGAALSYALLITRPERIERTAALAGFIPQGGEQRLEQSKLNGKDIFIAHGSRDDTVPVDLARQAAQILENAGARVNYCEDDVGHKLSASCHKSLGAFFQ